MDLLKPELLAKYQRIAIALDFSPIDRKILNTAISLGGTKAKYYMLHVVVTAGSLILGNDIRDSETVEDNETLQLYSQQLAEYGYNVDTRIGFGNPKKAIPRYVEELKPDIIILGSHGHRFFTDLIFGTTIGTVRHKVNIPVLVVSSR